MKVVVLWFAWQINVAHIVGAKNTTQEPCANNASCAGEGDQGLGFVQKAAVPNKAMLENTEEANEAAESKELLWVSSEKTDDNAVVGSKDSGEMPKSGAEAKTECSADFGEKKACCGQPGDWWAAEKKLPNGLRNCPQNEPICHDYKEYVKMGICKAKTKTECSADFGEKKACCGQPGDWWAAEKKLPNGLRNCPQNEPVCHGYKEYVKMGICKAKAYDSCDGKTEGQPCQQCDPKNKDCMETAVMKTCQEGECRPSKAYDSCDGKTEGQPCKQCDPKSKDCMETAVLKTCQEGECRPSKARSKL